MALVDLDGRWLHVNRALCHLLGFSEEEMRARTFKDVTHPDDLDADVARVQELLDGGKESYRVPKRYINRDGEVIHVLLTVSVLRDDENRPKHFIAQIQDISGREALSPIDGMPELPRALHFVAGFDGYFKKLSRTWSEVLGHSVETLLSKPYIEFVHPEDRAKTIEQAKKVASGEESVLFENRYQHLDGTYRWLLWTTISAAAEKSIYGVAIDYTERKQLELALLNSLQEQQRLYEELDAATSRIQKLRNGLVRICAWTKRIYHEGRWISTDEFLSEHLQLNLTHGIYDEAVEKYKSDHSMG